MSLVFVIAPARIAATVGESLKSLSDVEAVEVPYPTKRAEERSHEWVLRAYNQLADAMEAAAEHRGPASLRNSLAILSLEDERLDGLADLNPIAADNEWSAVAAMLVLSFPEVHWCFYTLHEPPPSFMFAEAHVMKEIDVRAGLRRLLWFRDRGFIALFDPFGLRGNIRARIRRHEENQELVAPYVPVRPEVAAVVEEEEDYAYLNAYTAYRFGFRVHVLTSFGMMERVLDEIPVASPPGAECESHLSLVFEDLYLNFADKDPHKPLRLSDLAVRDDRFPKLSGVPQRIFMTVGHRRRAEDQQTWLSNRARLYGILGSRQYYKVIYKPALGIFDVWERSGMRRRLRHGGGRAPGFDWPPRHMTLADLSGGHSAPGRLLLIANRLVARAARIAQSANSVPDAIHGAVLALEAIEYLAHRTPTSSLEAVALKHKLEATAECMFYGIEYNIDVESRFEEIHSEVRGIGNWFRAGSRKMSQLNAEVRMVSELLTTFRQYNQFDEEQKSLVRIRALHRRLWLNRHRWVALPVFPLRWYVEFLLGSLPRFIAAIAVWILGLALVYGVMFHSNPESAELGKLSFLHGLSDAVTAFLGMQPPHDIGQLVDEYKEHGLAVMWITIVAITSSFVHLGIFISHLYSMLARR